MKLIEESDPRIVEIIPGVQQLWDGTLFRTAKLADGTREVVRYIDNDRYESNIDSGATFEANSIKYTKINPDGTRKVCTGWQS